MLHAPYLVSDQNRTVHAFNVESDGAQEFVIVHREWSFEHGWTAPVGVLLPEYLGEAARLRGVLYTHDTQLHLVYIAGDLVGSNIYYSHAYAIDANAAKAWSNPIPVTLNAGSEAAAALTGDGMGKLVIVYGGERYGVGIYEVHSIDGGHSWSNPVVLSRTTSMDLWPASIWLETDDHGRVHVVWHIADSRGEGKEIRYGRLDSSLSNWEHEQVVAVQETELDLIGMPSVISSGDNLILVFQDGFPPTRWVQQSHDGGETWSKPARPFAVVGGLGVGYLVKDSAETIHLLIGNRLEVDQGISGMWYSRLQGNQWLPIEPVQLEPPSPTYGPCCPQGVISQGNVMLATWAHNVRDEDLTGAWYAYAVLDVPELPVQPLESAPDIAEETSPDRVLGTEAAMIETPTVPPTEIVPAAGLDSARSPGMASPIFLGTIPALLGSAGYILFRMLTRGRELPEATRQRKNTGGYDE